MNSTEILAKVIEAIPNGAFQAIILFIIINFGSIGAGVMWLIKIAIDFHDMKKDIDAAHEKIRDLQRGADQKSKSG